MIWKNESVIEDKKVRTMAVRLRYEWGMESLKEAAAVPES